MRIEAILTPAEIAGLPQRDLSAATCVVFDVLRATSTILTALANGASRVYPVSTVEQALTFKRTRRPEALLGGERGGVRINGFDLGNSPGEYTAERVAGRDIISTTTNGTVALRACAGAGQLLAGAWLNLDALTIWLRQQTAEQLVLVCAGTGKRFALEDGLAAGGLIARLTDRRGGRKFSTYRFEYDDAALAMLAMYESVRSEPLRTLRQSENGGRLSELGLSADVKCCIATTRLPWVAVMREGALGGEFVEISG